MQHTQTNSIHKEILRKLINRFRVHQCFLIDGVGNTLLSFQLANGRMNGFKMEILHFNSFCYDYRIRREEECIVINA